MYKDSVPYNMGITKESRADFIYYACVTALKEQSGIAEALDMLATSGEFDEVELMYCGYCIGCIMEKNRSVSRMLGMAHNVFARLSGGE